MDQEPKSRLEPSSPPPHIAPPGPPTGSALESPSGPLVEQLAGSIAGPLTYPPSDDRLIRDADHRASLLFEHGTDAEMIERRVRTASPLASPSPGPGASSTLRREVLYCLRTGGPASPDQIAQVVGASRTGVLQQLRTLEMAGLVTRSLNRHGVGRPRHVYDLTSAAQELFPANYGAFAQSFLAAIRQIGGEELIHSVFEARRELLKTRIQRRLHERLSSSAGLWERTREVASYQDETGYLGRATLDEDGTIRLSEHNCAISGVSGPYPIACEQELRLFGEVLGASVTRECHIASGGRSCTYRIEPTNGKSSHS